MGGRGKVTSPPTMNLINEELFGFQETSKPKDHLEILPVSVIDIQPLGKQGIRGDDNHDKKSSRSGYSAFPHEIAELCSSLFLKNKSLVVDPFAGWGERGSYCKKHDVPYVGFDISTRAIENALTKFGVSNTLADSRFVQVPEHDGLFTCPPYWGLEKYQSDDGLDKIKNWTSFIDQYKAVLKRFSDKAKPDSTYCIMTGDWRDSGIYYDLTYQTEKIMDELGFQPFDKIVVSRLKISKVKIMLPQAKRLGYTVKVHENLSVFKKNK